MRAALKTIGPALVAAATILIAPSAHALCIYDGKLYAKTTLPQEFRDSNLVVRGRVLSARDIPRSDPEADPLELDTIKPIEVFKGSAPPVIRYYEEHNSGAFYLDVGQEYILYLNSVEADAFGKGIASGFVVNYNCGQSREWAKVPKAVRAQLNKLAAKR